MQRPRQAWIDVLRGIGIILVVWGHVYGGYSFDLIFLFHMPLFFFLSGYLFRPVTDFPAFGRRKTVQLLLPYAVFLLAIGVPLGVVQWWQQAQALPALVVSLVLGGSRLSAWLAAFWFVTSFFAVLLLEAWLIGRYRRRRLLWLHAVMLLLAYANSAFLPGLQVPWALNVALAAAPFFYAGHLYAQLPPAPRQRVDRLALRVALPAAALVLLNHGMGWHLDLGYDMKVAHYGMPGVSFVAALACCVSMARLARGIDAGLPSLARGLAQLGQAAIVIMFMHMVFTMGVGRVVGEQHQLLRVLAGLLGSYLLYRVSLGHTWSRALLLGSVFDLDALRGRTRAMHG